MTAAAVVAVAAFGGWSEVTHFGADDWRRWVPDAVVGASYLVLAVSSRSRAPRVALVAAAVAGAWWLGNVEDIAAYWSRAPLVLLVLTYPDIRPTSRANAVALATSALFVALPAVGATELGTVAFGIVVLVGSLARVRATLGRARRLRRVAVRAATALAVGSIGGAGLRTILDPAATADHAAFLYEASLVTAAVVLTRGLRPPPTTPIVDAVVELSAETVPSTRDALAQLLDDPLLELGFETSDGWVDSEGEMITPPERGADRVATIIDHDRGPRAIIVHDASLLDDGVLLSAIGKIAALWSDHAELDAAVREQIAELTASRRRLADVEQEELQRIAEQLAKGPGHRLASVDRLLHSTPHDAIASTTAAAIDRAADRLEQTIVELDAIVHGLAPFDAESDLGAAIRELATRSPVPVEVPSVELPRLPRPLATILYFCCSEAIANAVKHARATRITVELSASSACVRVEVGDDGIGGADPASGSGLDGLADRVGAVGGALRIVSPPDAGTRVIIELPFEDGR